MTSVGVFRFCRFTTPVLDLFRDARDRGVFRGQSSGFRGQGSGFGLQGSGFGVQGSGFKVRDSGFRAQGLGFGVQGSGFKVRDSGFRVQGSGFGAQDSGFRVQGSGFRVQGSGFPVYDLLSRSRRQRCACRAWSLGSRFGHQFWRRVRKRCEAETSLEKPSGSRVSTNRGCHCESRSLSRADS